MGIRINEQQNDTDFGIWVGGLCNIVFQRMFQLWYHPDIIFYNLPIGRRFKRYNKAFLDYTDKVKKNERGQN